MKNMYLVVACAMCLTASAADVALDKTNDYNAGFRDSACWAPSGEPSGGNDYWLLSESKIFYSKAGNKGNESFAGRSLNIGSPSSSAYGFTSGKVQLATISASKVTIPNLVWWSGQLNTGYNGTHLWYGTWTIRQADAEAYHRTGLNAYQHCYTNFVTLTSSDSDLSAADAVIELGVGSSGTYPGSITYETMSKGTYGHHHFRGDFSGYKGSILVTAPYQPVVLFNGTIIGDPATPNSRAIRLGTNAVFALGADFEQNTSRGIEVYGDQAYFMTWTSVANEWTLRYPVSGVGSVVKDGPGKVTLACDWTAGDITVAAGTLEIDRTASVKAETAIKVKKDATLIVWGADCWRSGITVDQGGTVVRHPVASYDSTSGLVTEMVSIPSGVKIAAGEKIDFALSDSIALPCHEGKRLAVATLGEGSTLTAEDFVDVTAKTCDLPMTSFEIEDGTLYLSVRPVVTSVQAFADYDHVSLNGHDVNVNTNYWSNNARAQPGFDYLLRHNVNRMGSEGFLGDSLSILNCTVYTRAETSRISAAGKSTTVYPPVVLQPNHGNWRTHKVVGDIVLKSTYDTSSDTMSLRLKGILGNGGTLAESIDLRANIAGDGTILVIGDSNTVDTTTYHMGLHGDNTEFLGRIYLASSKGAAKLRNQTTRLCFSEAKNLGGSPDKFRYDAIKVGNYAMLNPDATMVFDTANRGIHMIAGGFEVPAGVTFTSKVPLRQEGLMYKLGAGTLKLGGTICYKADGKALVADSGRTTYVEEGAIAAGSDDGVKNMYLSFSDGAAIQVSPDDGLVNGFTGTILIPSGKVKVVLDPTIARGRSAFLVPICTLAASATDISDALMIDRVNGYAGQLVKENVMVDGKDCVRYSVMYEAQGAVLIVR